MLRKVEDHFGSLALNRGKGDEAIEFIYNFLDNVQSQPCPTTFAIIHVARGQGVAMTAPYGTLSSNSVSLGNLRFSMNQEKLPS